MDGPKLIDQVPPWRQDTYRVIRSTYPDGVPSDEYDPLVYVLHEVGQMSYRSVASVLDDCGVQEYHRAYHDAIRVDSQKDKYAVAAKPVLEKLTRHGFDPTAE
jgi:hypothetical protein